MRVVLMKMKLFWLLAVPLAFVSSPSVHGAISSASLKMIRKINREGPYLGLVIPNAFEMTPLLQSPRFVHNKDIPFFDFSGLATELLLSLFKVKGVVHFGIAGNANSDYQIGDVVIPHYWAHTGLWNWQRYGDGPDDELAFESFGDYTREIGYLEFSDYNNGTKKQNSSNLLNSIWYQPEEIFPINGIPETRQHAFWVPVDKHYFAAAEKLENMKLEGCINSTCLPRSPKVIRVERGSSANIFVDNAAYRGFLNTKFNITPIDMESAAVALVCHQQKTPFIVFRALSDLAGGGSAESNEANTFSSLAAQNAVSVVVQFIKLF